MTDQPSGEHLLANDVAMMAGCSSAAIRAADKTGRITAAHVTPGHVRIYLRKEAERFCEARAAVKLLREWTHDAWRGK